MTQIKTFGRGSTIPMPWLKFSSAKYYYEVEAETIEEANAKLDTLEQAELARLGLSDVIIANDRLERANKFIRTLLEDKVLGKIVREKLDTFNFLND